MSDGISQSYKDAKRYDKYENIVSGIRKKSVVDIIKMFPMLMKCENEGDLITIIVSSSSNFEILYGEGYYMRGSTEYDVKVPIPGYLNTEDFRGTVLIDLLYRAAGFVLWTKTELGKRAIKGLD